MNVIICNFLKRELIQLTGTKNIQCTKYILNALNILKILKLNKKNYLDKMESRCHKNQIHGEIQDFELKKWKNFLIYKHSDLASRKMRWSNPLTKVYIIKFYKAKKIVKVFSGCLFFNNRNSV